MTLKKRWNIWDRRRQKTMPLPGTSLESCFVRENWCRRILPEDCHCWRNSRKRVSLLQLILSGKFTSMKKAGRMCKRPSAASIWQRMTAIPMRNTSLVRSTISEMESVLTREKGLEYLVQSAAHGNMYAENLLRVIRQQHIRGAASLIAQLGRIFQEKEQQDRVRHQQPDRKQRRQIDEKKQAMGIRD